MKAWALARVGIRQRIPTWARSSAVRAVGLKSLRLSLGYESRRDSYCKQVHTFLPPVTLSVGFCLIGSEHLA